jgi:hypothetical protein
MNSLIGFLAHELHDDMMFNAERLACACSLCKDQGLSKSAIIFRWMVISISRTQYLILWENIAAFGNVGRWAC